MHTSMRISSGWVNFYQTACLKSNAVSSMTIVEVTLMPELGAGVGVGVGVGTGPGIPRKSLP